MREIKFRACGKYGNNPHKMHYDDDITPFGDSENAMPGEVIRILQENYGWIFMQYTGLKDKNGVEIYEGDILRWTDENNESDDYQVIFEAPSFKYAHLEHPDYLGGTAAFTELEAESDFEVIGNIYENSELLNGNKE